MSISFIVFVNGLLGHLRLEIAFASNQINDRIGRQLLYIVVVVGYFFKGAHRGDIIGNHTGIAFSIK